MYPDPYFKLLRLAKDETTFLELQSMPKITPLFWSQILEKSGVILGTPKNGQKSKKNAKFL